MKTPNEKGNLYLNFQLAKKPAFLLQFISLKRLYLFACVVRTLFAELDKGYELNF